MSTTTAFVPAADLVSSVNRITPGTPGRASMPRDCTFSESDWRALAPQWYPVAFSHEVTHQPYAARLLDERVVVYRLADGRIAAAKDICFHRGAPLSLGHVEGDLIVCKYHGLKYDASGRCVCIPAHPTGTISPRLRLHMLRAQEAFGLVWVQLEESDLTSLPVMDEWLDPEYVQVLPNCIAMNASAGRQMEGFLDVSHFAFVHLQTFGLGQDPAVPDYAVTKTPRGFVADYFSTVTNYSLGFTHLNPPGFVWHRRFEVFLPFTAKLTVTFPGDGKLHILNACSPVSARKMRLFVPIVRNFDRDAPMQPTLDFNHAVFAEDQAIVEEQYPEDLPLDLHAEAHFPPIEAPSPIERDLLHWGWVEASRRSGRQTSCGRNSRLGSRCSERKRMVAIQFEYQGDLHCTAIHGPSQTQLDTDAPTDNQGRGESFSPTDLVATALGTCMLTVMGIMARTLAIDIAGTTATVEKEMTTAAPRRIASLAVRIHVPHEISDENRQKLERAAHTCPVHKSLHPDIHTPIEFTWK